MAKKRSLDVNRCYFRVGDPMKGTAMTDRTKFLGEYIPKDSKKEQVIYFKDLGMQVSWTTVFLVEYAGPLLISLILAFFRE